MNIKRKTPYDYKILRYVHDITTGEFVNVGVVVASKDGHHISAKFRLTYGRIKQIFPNLDGEIFRSRLRQIQSSFDKISSGDFSFTHDCIDEKKTINYFTQKIIPNDDSSLQWSPSGHGLSNDLPTTLASLYQRFIAQYDIDISGEHRKDEDIWKIFKSSLEKRNILSKLEEKTISTADDSIRFKHAWKNGQWNCLEPLSFDLSSDSSIKDKAIRWLGQISSIQDTKDEFSVYFLIGKPSNIKFYEAYRKAMNILKKSPAAHVVEEDKAEEFSTYLDNAIKQHGESEMLFYKNIKVD